MTSILLYNCGTCALTLKEEERLNAYHLRTTENDPEYQIPHENNKQIFTQNLLRKATINTNPIRSPVSLWSLLVPQIKQLGKDNLANSVQQRPHTDSTSN